MKYEFPMYDGDSIIRRGPGIRTEPEEHPSAANCNSIMVHRSMPLREADPLAFDAGDVERRARALRAAAVRSAFVGFWTWLERSLENARKRREEEYLARAQSIAELEARLRRLERSGQLVRI